MGGEGTRAMTTGQDQRRRQRTKNIALGMALVALVALFYLITLVKMGGSP